MNRRTRLARWVALGTSAAALVIYPLSALVLAGPKTPITFALHPAVASYMHPHFPQNWNLFAPDPISEERGALARYRCGVDAAPTEWVNITERGIEKIHATRLFPSRESRVISNSIITRFREDDVILRVDRRAAAAVTSDEPAPSDAADSVTEPSGEASSRPDPLLDPLREASKQEKEDVERVLARYASARHDAVCQGAPASEVQIRFVFHKFPGWSGRDDLTTTGEVQTFDTEWIRP